MSLRAIQVVQSGRQNVLLSLHRCDSRVGGPRLKNFDSLEMLGLVRSLVSFGRLGLVMRLLTMRLRREARNSPRTGSVGRVGEASETPKSVATTGWAVGADGILSADADAGDGTADANEGTVDADDGAANADDGAADADIGATS